MTTRQRRPAGTDRSAPVKTVITLLALLLMPSSTMAQDTDSSRPSLNERLRAAAIQIFAAQEGWQAMREKMGIAELRQVPAEISRVEERTADQRRQHVSAPLTDVERRDSLVEISRQETRLGAVFPNYLRLSGKETKLLERLKIRCGRFADHVTKTAHIFQIPEVLLYGLIYHESGCNPTIKNPKSSATGLTQIVNDTWNWLRVQVRRDLGVELVDRRHVESSLTAGGWYLNHLFRVSRKKRPLLKLNRKNLNDWRLALQYYYAGPGCGPKKECRPEKHDYSDSILSISRQL